MFERFAERAIRVIMAAQEEAKKLKSHEVGTEHLLIGMLNEKEPSIITVLESFNVPAEELKEKIESRISQGSSAASEVPFSPAVKKAIELSWEEARTLGHSYIGVEHLFLAILRENSGMPAEIF